MSRTHRFLPLTAVLWMLLAAAPMIGTAAAGPVLSFDRIEHDFGPLWEGESRTTSFRFRNTGDEPLRIEAIRADCGCTTTTLDRMVFAPGEGDEIAVNFDAKGRGDQRKGITVVSNAGRPVRLMIATTVRQFLAAEPAVVRIGDLELGEQRTARVRITSADPAFTPRRVSVRGAAARFVSARLVPPAAGPAPAGPRPAGPQLPGRRDADAAGGAAAAGEDGFEVEVTVGPGLPWGMLFATLRIEGEGTRPGDAAGRGRHELDVTVSGRAFGEIMASDTMLRVSRVPAGRPFRRVVTLTSRSGEPLPLLEARLLQPEPASMRVSLEPEAATQGRRWRLTLDGDPGGATGRVSGTVILTSGVPGEERLTLLVAGMIAED